MTPVGNDRIRRSVPIAARFERGLDAGAPGERGVGYGVQVHAGGHGGVGNRKGGARRTLLGVRVDGEKRVELEVPAGQRAFLVVVSGAGRIEGDDTAVKTDDIVWFKPNQGDEPVFLGLEADVEMRALLYSEAELE